MKKIIFRGSGVAVATPFDAGGRIDFPKLGELIEFQIKNKTDCIVICGTTGESSTMTEAEHVECIGFAVEKVGGRLPVIAGTGSNNTTEAVFYTKEAAKAGADGALVVTPYYNKTSQEGLYRHFNTVADAADIPVMLYNVPSRTGVNIKPETYARLAKHPNINSVKEANGDIGELVRTAELTGGELNIYSGEDSMIVPVLSVGGLGVVSVLANICPAETHEMCALWFEGKTTQALALQKKYIKLVKLLFSDVNPIPVKTALGAMGLCEGNLRLPLCEMSEPLAGELLGEMKALKLI